MRPTETIEKWVSFISTTCPLCGGLGNINGYEIKCTECTFSRKLNNKEINNLKMLERD